MGEFDKWGSMKKTLLLGVGAAATWAVKNLPDLLQTFGQKAPEGKEVGKIGPYTIFKDQDKNRNG